MMLIEFIEYLAELPGGVRVAVLFVGLPLAFLLLTVLTWLGMRRSRKREDNLAAAIGIVQGTTTNHVRTIGESLVDLNERVDAVESSGGGKIEQLRDVQASIGTAVAELQTAMAGVTLPDEAEWNEALTLTRAMAADQHHASSQAWRRDVEALRTTPAKVLEMDNRLTELQHDVGSRPNLSELTTLQEAWAETDRVARMGEAIAKGLRGQLLAAYRSWNDDLGALQTTVETLCGTPRKNPKEENHATEENLCDGCRSDARDPVCVCTTACETCGCRRSADPN